SFVRLAEGGLTEIGPTRSLTLLRLPSAARSRQTCSVEAQDCNVAAQDWWVRRGLSCDECLAESGIDPHGRNDRLGRRRSSRFGLVHRDEQAAGRRGTSEPPPGAQNDRCG